MGQVNVNDNISVKILKGGKWNTSKFLHEFQCRGWSKSWFHFHRIRWHQLGQHFMTHNVSSRVTNS